MYFSSISEFFAMGGYALYVWLAFGSGFACVALLWVSSWLGKKKLFAQVLIEQARQERIRQAKQEQTSSQP